MITATPVSALALAGRSLRISRRSPDALIAALMLPVMLMLIFVYFFGGAIDTGTQYVTYVVPGAMLLCAGFGAASTAVSVADDMRTGIIDR
ncbi:ABC transporter permease, partial [Streptomyces virginiae]